jgi:hypothetical protein
MSSNVYGQLYKINYEVQILVRHTRMAAKKELKVKPNIQIPITILTPNKTRMSKYKPRMNQMQDLDVKLAQNIDLELDEDNEDQVHPYAKFRKWLIGRESQLNFARGHTEEEDRGYSFKMIMNRQTIAQVQQQPQNQPDEIGMDFSITDQTQDFSFLNEDFDPESHIDNSFKS